MYVLTIRAPLRICVVLKFTIVPKILFSFVIIRSKYLGCQLPQSGKGITEGPSFIISFSKITIITT